MEYRKIIMDEMNLDLFSSFERYQEVTKCRRKIDGQWVIVDDPFIDQWSKDEYEVLVSYLKNTIKTYGVVFGAFIDGKLKGFASVESTVLGSKGEYLDLSSIHVSYDSRGKGIGKKLFNMSAKWAKDQGASKLYISAHSAVESQKFYEVMGCVEAAEYNEEHVKREPCDCQLEYVL